MKVEFWVPMWVAYLFFIFVAVDFVFNLVQLVLKIRSSILKKRAKQREAMDEYIKS